MIIIYTTLPTTSKCAVCTISLSFVVFVKPTRIRSHVLAQASSTSVWPSSVTDMLLENWSCESQQSVCARK
jgi:hypothetical protein